MGRHQETTRTERRILRGLESGLSFIGEFTAKYGISDDRVSRHLTALHRLGLADWVEETKEAREKRLGRPGRGIRRLWHLTDAGRKLLNPEFVDCKSHLVELYTNPYLVCLTCCQPVEGVHDPDLCKIAAEDGQCSEIRSNQPCGCAHPAVKSACKSWHALHGCRCVPRCEIPDDRKVLG